MNYQSARIFLAVVECGSFSAAADTLYLSRPAVSSYLSRLEDELGVQLFVRNRGVQKVTLTPEGTNFIPVAKELLLGEKRLQEFKDACKQKTLRIGASRATQEYLVMPIAEKLRQAFQEIDLQLCIIPTGASTVMDTPQPYDIALRLTRYDHPPSTALFQQIPFFWDPPCILCPADTLLPDRMLTPDALDLSFELRYSVVAETTAKWYAEHFPDNVASRYPAVRKIMSVANLFDDPRCWFLINSSLAAFLIAQNPGKLTTRQISPAPPQRLASIMVSKSYTRTDVVDVFIRCCREYLAERPQLKGILPDDI